VPVNDPLNAGEPNPGAGKFTRAVQPLERFEASPYPIERKGFVKLPLSHDGFTWTPPPENAD
jgi:hypothetical protein